MKANRRYLSRLPLITPLQSGPVSTVYKGEQVVYITPLLTASILFQLDWRLRGGLFVMLFSPFSEPANFSQFPIDCLFADLQVGRDPGMFFVALGAFFSVATAFQRLVLQSKASLSLWKTA